MVHLAVLAIAGLFAIGCSSNDKDIPKKSQPKLSPGMLPPPPKKPSKAEAPKPQAPALDQPIPKDKYFGPDKRPTDQSLLTPARISWHGMFDRCFFKGPLKTDLLDDEPEPAQKGPSQGSDLDQIMQEVESDRKKQFKCLKEAFEANPNAFTMEEMATHFFHAKKLAWKNVRAYQHYDDRNAFSQMKLYGGVLGLKGSKIKEVEKELKAAYQAQLKLQEDYCPAPGKVAPTDLPPKDLVCPKLKAIQIKGVDIEGKLPGKSQIPGPHGTDLRDDGNDEGPTVPGTDLPLLKKSKGKVPLTDLPPKKAPPKPGSLEDRITNPYQ